MIVTTSGRYRFFVRLSIFIHRVVVIALIAGEYKRHYGGDASYFAELTLSSRVWLSDLQWTDSGRDGSCFTP